MNTDEIFDNRRHIAKKICKAIRDNGGQLCSLTEFSTLFQAVMDDFEQEENSYLSEHPELLQIS